MKKMSLFGSETTTRSSVMLALATPTPMIRVPCVRGHVIREMAGGFLWRVYFGIRILSSMFFYLRLSYTLLGEVY